jgi:hypothetical protein
MSVWSPCLLTKAFPIDGLGCWIIHACSEVVQGPRKQPMKPPLYICLLFVDHLIRALVIKDRQP